jgi:MFS family permease
MSEGIAAAAIAPSILAYLTDVTDTDTKRRGRVMSYFELSLLAGIALGGPVGGQFWKHLGLAGFTVAAVIYLMSSACFAVGAGRGEAHPSARPGTALKHVMDDPLIRKLAPSWLCINAIVGLWLGPIVVYLLTRSDPGGQYLAGLFTGNPEDIGWLLFGYFVLFASGVTAWSFVLHRFSRKRVLVVALTAMLTVCIGLYVLNHSDSWSAGSRWLLISAIAAAVMVESGFTPAALALLADIVGGRGSRGTAMGIYSALLGVGAVAGALIATVLGTMLAIDGLIFGTLGLAVLAMLTLRNLPAAIGRENHG